MLYPALRARRGEPGVLNAVAAAAEGYAFPTDLDRDQPVDGLAPPSQAGVVRLALAEDRTPDELNARLAEHAARRHA